MYCGNAIIAGGRRPRRGPSAKKSVAEPRRSSGPVIVAVVAGLVLLSGAIAAVVLIKVDPTQSSKARAQAAKERAHAELTLAEARLERAEVGAERAEVGAERAEVGAERAELEAERERQARPGKKPRPARRVAPAKKANQKPDLPATPSPAAVRQIFKRMNAQDCPGPGTVGCSLQIKPDGTLKVASVGPIRGPGGMLSCIRRKLSRLRFPASREGLHIKHVFDVPGP